MFEEALGMRSKGVLEHGLGGFRDVVEGNLGMWLIGFWEQD